MTAPFYTLISSVYSHIWMCAGVFAVALVKGELSAIWRYEVKAVVNLSSKPKDQTKEKLSVSEVLGFAMDNGEDSKESKEVLVDV